MVLRKAHMPSTQFHCSSGCMPMALSQIRCSSDCMARAISRPFKEYRQAPTLSTSLSYKRSMVRFSVLSSSTLHVDLPRRKPRVIAVLSTSVSTRSFPFTRACPGRYTHKRFRRRVPTIGLPITFFTFCSKLIEYVRMKARMVWHLLSWLLATLCLLIGCEDRCTTRFVPCLDWWEIPCRASSLCFLSRVCSRNKKKEGRPYRRHKQLLQVVVFQANGI